LCLSVNFTDVEAADGKADNGINAIAFAANGRKIAAAYQNGNVVLVDVEKKRLRRFLPTAGGLAVTGISFMDTDKQVLSAGVDGFILLRDANSGGRLRRFDGNAVPVQALAVSPDGRTIVSGGDDGVIRLWDVDNGKIVQQRKVSEEGVTALAVSPAGGVIASISASGRVSLVDANRRLASAMALGQRDTATAIAFTADGKTLLSGGPDGHVREWDPKTLANNKSSFLGAPITALSVSPDARTVAVGMEGSAIVLWDLATGSVAGTLSTNISFVSVLAFSPDGTIVAAGGGENGDLVLLNVRPGEVVQSVRPFARGEGGEDEGTPAAEMASGASESASTSATTGGSSSSSAKQAAIAPAATPTAALPPNAVTALGLDPSGTLIASGLANGKVILWDRASRTQVRPFEGHNNLPVTAISFTSAGLQSAGRDSVVRAWNALDGREQYKLQLHEHAIRALVESNNGQSVAAAGEDLRIGIWGRDQRLQNVLVGGHKDFINALAFSNNNLVLASGSADDTINVWDVKTGRLMRTIRGHTGDVTALTFARNGKTLVSASTDTTIRFWDIDTGQQVQILRGPANPVRSIAISPNEKFLVAGGDDPEIFNWDLATNQLTRTASVLKGRVTAVAVAPDETTIVSGDEAGEISLFNATSGIRTGLILTATSPEAQPTSAPGGVRP
jgi:WD40 repeat protein